MWRWRRGEQMPVTASMAQRRPCSADLAQVVHYWWGWVWYDIGSARNRAHGETQEKCDSVLWRKLPLEWKFSRNLNALVRAIRPKNTNHPYRCISWGFPARGAILRCLTSFYSRLVLDTQDWTSLLERGFLPPPFTRGSRVGGAIVFLPPPLKMCSA